MIVPYGRMVETDHPLWAWVGRAGQWLVWWRVSSGMRPIAECDGDRISHERRDPLRLFHRQLDGQTAVQDEHHAVVVACHVGLKEGHAPTIDHHVMMNKRSRKLHAKVGKVIRAILFVMIGRHDGPPSLDPA